MASLPKSTNFIHKAYLGTLGQRETQTANNFSAQINDTNYSVQVTPALNSDLEPPTVLRPEKDLMTYKNRCF